MTKLHLDLDSLRIETFEAGATLAGSRGTVHGAGAREFYTDLNAYSCGSSCLGRCYASFNQPCGP